jgi:hypothetical protein
MKGNFVMLRGHFTDISASTDGTVSYSFPLFRQKGSDVETFFEFGDEFVKVRISKEYFMKVTKQGSIGVLEECSLEGTLHAEVSRGTGIIEHYVRAEALTK